MATQLVNLLLILENQRISGVPGTPEFLTDLDCRLGRAGLVLEVRADRLAPFERHEDMAGVAVISDLADPPAHGNRPTASGLRSRDHMPSSATSRGIGGLTKNQVSSDSSRLA